MSPTPPLTHLRPHPLPRYVICYDHNKSFCEGETKRALNSGYDRPILLPWYQAYFRGNRPGGGGGGRYSLIYVVMDVPPPKGYCFWAFLVWKRVYTLPILEICKFEMYVLFALWSKIWWHNFCLKARSENGYWFWRSGLKTGVEKDIFLSETGSGVGEPGGTSLPKISRRTPRGKRHLAKFSPAIYCSYIARTQR